MKAQKLFSAFTCCILTFSIDFLLIPRLMRGIPDILWMAAMVLLPLELPGCFMKNSPGPPLDCCLPAWASSICC